jgi:hypothetical protein
VLAMHQGLTGHCAFLLAIIASLSESSRRNKFELCNVIYSIGWCKGAADLSVCLLLGLGGSQPWSQCVKKQSKLIN